MHRRRAVDEPGPCVAPQRRMPHQVLAVATLTAFLATASCTITTAHKVALAGNPLRKEAIACEVGCRPYLPAAQPAVNCRRSADSMWEYCPPVQEPDLGPYAACLDHCPGATSIQGDTCPDPPHPDLICATTSRADKAMVALGVGGMVIVVAVALVLETLPSLGGGGAIWLLLVL